MPAWTIACKELRLVARDRRALITLLVLPLLFIGVLGHTAGRLVERRLESQRLRIAWVDASDSPAVDRLRRDFAADVAIRLAVCDTLAEARERLEDDESDVLLRFGPDVPADVENGAPAEDAANALAALDVRVEHRPSYPYAAALVRRIVLDGLRRPSTMAGKSGDADGADPEPVETPPPAWSVYQEIVPSLTVMFAFFLVIVMGRLILQERDLGTLHRLRVAPLRPSALLLGKTVPFLLISIGQSVALLLCGRYVFGMHFGPQPWLLPAVVLCTSATATAMGLMLASLVRTDAQVSAYGNLLVLGMAAISGCLVPRDWLPESLRAASLVTPHAWALHAYHELLVAPSPHLPSVLGDCAVVLVFGAAFFAVGWWRFRRHW